MFDRSIAVDDEVHFSQTRICVLFDRVYRILQDFQYWSLTEEDTRAQQGERNGLDFVLLCLFKRCPVRLDQRPAVSTSAGSVVGANRMDTVGRVKIAANRGDSTAHEAALIVGTDDL